MTKEIRDIVFAFRDAHRQGRQTALATVVHVEGSSYRRPGARMLVEDNGRITGAISGGCLEGDALRKALLAINQRQNKLVTYNTLDEDDFSFGVQLGCNGIVHILFEPIDLADTNNPIVLLEKCLLKPKDSVLVTLFSLKNYHGLQPGTCYFLNDESCYGKTVDESFGSKIKADAATALANKSSSLSQYKEGELIAFVELVEPPVSLVIVGAGNDAFPLVDMATALGWKITVVDGRSTHANSQRFSKADRVIVGKPADIIEQIGIDERTVFVLITHNFNYDLGLLRLLLKNQCSYIGVLGPQSRMERLLTELQKEGFAISEEHRQMIYGPTGLDIGAEGAEEIALSILSEIKAVLAKRQGSFLRDRNASIHNRSTFEVSEVNTDAQ